jgi:hypothetical protein
MMFGDWVLTLPAPMVIIAAITAWILTLLPVPVVAAFFAVGIAVMVVASKMFVIVDTNDENNKKISQLLDDISKAEGDEREKLIHDFWRSGASNAATAEEDNGRSAAKSNKPRRRRRLAKDKTNDHIVSGSDDGVKAENDAAERVRKAEAADVSASKEGAKKKKKASSAAEKGNNEEDETCSICFDIMSAPVNLRCGHSFCGGCLDNWRSKCGNCYDLEGEVWDKTCPLCRKKLPPTAEMVARLNSVRLLMEHCKETNDREGYLKSKADYEVLKEKIGDYDEDDVIGKERFSVELPEELRTYVGYNDISSILNWVGLPADERRLEAGHPVLSQQTMLHIAAMLGQTRVMSVLLQLGANVNALDLAENTPFHFACMKVPREHCFFPSNSLDTCKLLLEWGAEVPNKSDIVRLLSKYATEDKNDDDEDSFYEGYQDIINLLCTELGGRRCEIVNMQNRTDLNGKTCLVDHYSRESGRYKVILESTKEVFSMRPKNLMRRDRTPTDCGYYIEVMQEGKSIRQGYTSTQERGLYAVKSIFGCSLETCKMVRYDFSSKEECQEFVKEVNEEGWDPVETEGEKSLEILKGKKSKFLPSAEELIAKFAKYALKM